MDVEGETDLIHEHASSVENVSVIVLQGCVRRTDLVWR